MASPSCGDSRPVPTDAATNGSGGGSGTGSGGRGEGTGGGAAGSGGRGAGGEATGGTTVATGGRGAGGSTATGGHGGGGSGTGGVNASGGRGGGGGGTSTGGASPIDAGTGDGGTAGCAYGGHTYALGASFPATDGCNTCTCGAGGVVGCTKIGCVDSGACALDTSYGFWDDGGFRAYADMSKLTLPRTHTISRDRFMNAPPDTCTREVPCNSTTEVDVTEIQQALAHPDVVAALGMTTKPFFGTDPRPVDGTVFIFQRADGRGFTAGSGNAVPAGVRALRELLRMLQTETLASTECAKLR